MDSLEIYSQNDVNGIKDILFQILEVPIRGFSSSLCCNVVVKFHMKNDLKVQNILWNLRSKLLNKKTAFTVFLSSVAGLGLGNLSPKQGTFGL
jgi:hypothetical protein